MTDAIRHLGLLLIFQLGLAAVPVRAQQIERWQFEQRVSQTFVAAGLPRQITAVPETVAPSTFAERSVVAWIGGTVGLLAAGPLSDRFPSGAPLGLTMAAGVTLGVHMATGAREGMRIETVVLGALVGAAPLILAPNDDAGHLVLMGAFVSWFTSPILAAAFHEPARRL